MIDGVSIKQTTDMPMNGRVVITVSEETNLAVRIPSWATKWSASIQGEVKAGYLHVRVTEKIVLDFEMKPRPLYAHANLGKDEMCLQRGPLIYCVEDVDNDVDVDHLKLLPGSVVDGKILAVCGQKIMAVEAQGQQMVPQSEQGLYVAQPWEYEKEPRTVTAIPFFLRANRGGGGKMRVWVPRVSTG